VCVVHSPVALLSLCVQSRHGDELSAVYVRLGLTKQVTLPPVMMIADLFRSVPKFWTHRTNFYCFCDTSVREKAGAAASVSCRRRERRTLLAGGGRRATRLQQAARPLSACTCF
jgi:hypothetical protein